MHTRTISLLCISHPSRRKTIRIGREGARGGKLRCHALSIALCCCFIDADPWKWHTASRRARESLHAHPVCDVSEETAPFRIVTWQLERGRLSKQLKYRCDDLLLRCEAVSHSNVLQKLSPALHGKQDRTMFSTTTTLNNLLVSAKQSLASRIIIFV
jgi:hypothetical protein